MRGRQSAGFWLVVIVAAGIVALLSSDSEPEERADRGERSGERSEPAPERSERKRRSEDREAAPEPLTPPAPDVPAEAERATVTDVTDGDTVELSGLGPSRLIGVDTPEVFFGAECFGAEASDFTASRLAPGTDVHYLHGDEREDRYERDLVYVWLEDGTFFNALLARRGYAVPLAIAPNVRFAGLFERLADAARSAGRGLWSPRTCGGDADLPAD